MTFEGRSRGGAVSRTGCEVGVAFLEFDGVFSLFTFLSLWRGIMGGRGSGCPPWRRDRTLHFGAGECRWEQDLGRVLKAGNPSSRHSPLGRDAVNIFDFTYGHNGAARPAVRKLWKEKATGAVLEFLEDVSVGRWLLARVARAPRVEEVGGGKVWGGEEGGPEPP